MTHQRSRGEVSVIGTLFLAVMCGLILSLSLKAIFTPEPTCQDSALVLALSASETARRPDSSLPALNVKAVAGLWTWRSSDATKGMWLELRQSGTFIARVQTGSHGSEVHALETSGTFAVEGHHLVFTALEGDARVLGDSRRVVVLSMPNADWLILGPNPVTFRRASIQ
jgi:hypothetical protein